MTQCRILPFSASEKSQANSLVLIGNSSDDRSSTDKLLDRLGLTEDEFVWMITEFLKARNANG